MKKMLFIVMLALSPMPVWAEDPSANARTRVEVNEGTETVTIFIDGSPVAKFTKDGLIVANNIEYGGTLRDLGHEAANGKMQSSEMDGAKRVGEENNAP